MYSGTQMFYYTILIAAVRLPSPYDTVKVTYAVNKKCHNFWKIYFDTEYKLSDSSSPIIDQV